MSKKKPFVLRLSPEMMGMLEKWAADEFRSVNGQIEWILHRSLKEAGRHKPSASQAKSLDTDTSTESQN
jgi:hypothetical protein